MKKIFYIAALATLISYPGCTDDKGPEINHDALTGKLDFHLNDSPYSSTTYVLTSENGDEVMDALTCVQPDYGFTAAVNYAVEIALDKEFNADFITLPTTVNGEKVNVITKEMNKGILQLWGWGNFTQELDPVEVFVRLKATISYATNNAVESDTIVKPAYSNVVNLNVLPYYTVLKDADPAPYYIIGLADGKWTNDAGGIGTSIYPLSLSPDFKYDAVTGAGEFIYTGYFTAGHGFKFIRDLGSWDEQWGTTSGQIPDFVHNDGGASNIDVPASGYYKIVLNSIDNKVTMDPVDNAPKVYGSMQLLGEFSGWDGAPVEMTLVDADNPHTWTTTVTFDADGGVKFRADNAWDNNWGGDSFPYGQQLSGNNIPTKAGTYIVTFNDVEGCYYFFEQ